MIEFGEVGKSDGYSEVKNLSYSEIKAGKDISPEKAQNFWNQVFEDGIKEDPEDDLEKCYADIFGRDEEEFKFNIDFLNPELIDKLALFREDIWDNLDISQKIDAVGGLIDVIVDLLGIDDKPILELFEAGKGSCGAFNAFTGVLRLNTALFDDPKEVVDTIAHELRHAYQDMRAQLGETRTDFLYWLNFDNYISPVYVGEGKCLFFTDYQDQLVEAEARAFGKVFKEAV